MHLPDGFLSLPMAGTGAVLAALGSGFSYNKLLQTENQHSPYVPSAAAALIFSAQALNFPITGGVSGHILGAALAAIFLGPLRASFIMTSVLLVQCFVFHDGGLTTLGINIFNMALAAVWIAWITYHLLGGNKRPFFAAAVAGWISIEAAAALCASEMVFSGMGSVALIFPDMLRIHGIIGLVEALMTGLIIFAGSQQRIKSRSLVGTQPIILLSVLVLISPLACQWPDGLEIVIQRLSISSRDMLSPLSNFEMSRAWNLWVYLAAMITTACGSLIVGILCWFLSYFRLQNHT